MITKQQQKYVQSLHNKKYRKEYREFLVEGEKAIEELLASDFEIIHIFCTEDFLEKKINFNNAIVCPPSVLEAISTFQSNNAGVAVVRQKENLPPNKLEGVTLFLDNLKDPGNLGTIIRLADWYGVKNIICSNETVEFYNPKVISATMGSFTRISIYYTDLESYLSHFPFAIYGADLEGKNVHHCSFEEHIGLVIGSESHGISPEISKLLTHALTIPKIGKAESLNAAMATGILLDNIFRKF